MSRAVEWADRPRQASDSLVRLIAYAPLTAAVYRKPQTDSEAVGFSSERAAEAFLRNITVRIDPVRTTSADHDAVALASDTGVRKGDRWVVTMPDGSTLRSRVERVAYRRGGVEAQLKHEF